MASLEILSCSQQQALLCKVKADGAGVHEVNTMSLCCACGVINLSGTCNSAELRSVTLLAGIVNPAGVSDSDYFMPELGSVRLISAWQPTWDVELRSVEQLIVD